MLCVEGRISEAGFQGQAGNELQKLIEHGRVELLLQVKVIFGTHVVEQGLVEVIRSVVLWIQYPVPRMQYVHQTKLFATMHATLSHHGVRSDTKHGRYLSVNILPVSSNSCRIHQAAE